MALADRLNNQTSLTYDAWGNLSSIIDPFGRTLNATTNSNGRILSLSDTLGTISTYTYGSNNELLSATYPDGSKYQFTYTFSPRLVLTSVKDALGNIVEAHTYDTQGRALTSEAQGGVERFTIAYLSDTETDVTDALNHTTKYYFGKSKGRNVVTAVEGICGCGNSQVQSWAYDDQANVITKTDGLSHTRSFTYDANGNRLTETDSSGTVSYTYNQYGLGEMAFKRTLSFLTVLAMLILLVYPFETTVVPEWKIRVVDASGSPLANVRVNEGWRDHSIEIHRSEQSLTTDSDGYVYFPRRTDRAGLLHRALGRGLAAFRVHGYAGPRGFADVVDPYLSETDADYSPGQPLPEVIVVRPQH